MKHATLAQVRTGRGGRKILVEEDVFETLRQLKELDPNLSVYWNDQGEYYAITEMTPGGEQLVTTATDLHAGAVEYVASLLDRDYRKEVDRLDRQADRRADQKLEQEVGEIGERMAHAIRKDLEHKGRIFVSKDV